MKFGTAMHISPPKLMSDQKFQNFKTQDIRLQTAVIMKIKKSRYLHNHLADFDEILHEDTY